MYPVLSLGTSEHLTAFHKTCGVLYTNGTCIILVLQCWRICLASLAPVNHLDGKQSFQNYCTQQVNLIISCLLYITAYLPRLKENCIIKKILYNSPFSLSKKQNHRTPAKLLIDVCRKQAGVVNMYGALSEQSLIDPVFLLC